MLTFALWVIVGVVAGIVGRLVVPTSPKTSRGARPPLTILAILGAIVSGMIGDFVYRAGGGALGPDYVSVLTAILGAAVIIAIARALEIHGHR